MPYMDVYTKYLGTLDDKDVHLSIIINKLSVIKGGGGYYYFLTSLCELHNPAS